MCFFFFVFFCFFLFFPNAELLLIQVGNLTRGVHILIGGQVIQRITSTLKLIALSISTTSTVFLLDR